jgi:hypothetical protein
VLDQARDHRGAGIAHAGRAFAREDVPSAVTGGEVQVAAVANRVRRGHRAERDPQPVAAGDPVGEQARQHLPVGGGEHAGRGEGELDLSGAVLGVDQLRLEAAAGELVGQVEDEVLQVEEREQAVRWSVVSDLGVVAVAAQRRELQLEGHREVQAQVRGRGVLAAQGLALAGRDRLELLRALVDRRPPQPGVAVDAGRGTQVGDQPHVPGRSAEVRRGGDHTVDPHDGEHRRQADALGRRRRDPVAWHVLGAGRPRVVDEGDEQVAGTVGEQVVGERRVVCGLGHRAPPCWRSCVPFEVWSIGICPRVV